MPGQAAKVRLSEQQLSILPELSHSRTVAKCVMQRATIMVLAFEGRQNREIAAPVGLNPPQVGTWRQRWRDSWESLCVWECHEPRRLREAILEALADAPRPGSPSTMTPEQIVQIIAVACEEPKLSGRPITRWTLDELRDEVLKRKIVPKYEYIRHGTTTLTAGLDVVTGRIVSPTLEATRTEPEFVAHIARTVSLDDPAEWIFVVDNLNTHASASLVEWVAQTCGLDDVPGKK